MLTPEHILMMEEFADLDDRLKSSNQLRVKKNPGVGEYSSVTAARAAIPTSGPDAVSPANPWVIQVDPGDYTEGPISMLPGLSIAGTGDRESVILRPSDTTNHFITVTEDSFLSRLTLHGPTTSGKATLFMSSPTATDAMPCWLHRMVFGAADTLILVLAVNNDNTLSMSDVRIGIGSFVSGFRATTTGTGKGRILGFQVSCGDLVSPFPDYIGYANGPGCVVNISTGRFRSSALTSGSC